MRCLWILLLLLLIQVASRTTAKSMTTTPTSATATTTKTDLEEAAELVHFSENSKICKFRQSVGNVQLETLRAVWDWWLSLMNQESGDSGSEVTTSTTTSTIAPTTSTKGCVISLQL